MPMRAWLVALAALLLAFTCAFICDRSEPSPQGQSEGAPLSRAEAKAMEGDFRAWQLSYPRGRFEPMWLVKASKQLAKARIALPEGADFATRSPQAKAGVLDPARFTALGPAPQQSGGFGDVAGRVNAILTDPTDPRVAWFGSDGGGVWKTTNCCGPDTNWTVKTDFPEIASIAIGDLALDPSNPRTLYAGTGDLRYGSFSFGAAGLLKSTDAGETWRILGLEVFNAVLRRPDGSVYPFPQYQAISKVVVDPANSNTVIVGTKSGVYFSYDGGENWSGPCRSNAFATQRQDITGLIANRIGAATRLLAAVGTRGHETPVQPDLDQNGANAIYRTTVPGSGCPASWDLLTTAANGWPAGTGSGVPRAAGAGGNPLGRIEIAVAPSDANVIYAQIADPQRSATFGNDYGVLGVWRSRDGGSSWVQVMAPSEFNIGCFASTPSGVASASSSGIRQAWYNAGMLVHPNDANLVYLSSLDLWRSRDGGETFSNLTCGTSFVASGVRGNVHVDHHARAFVGGDANRMLVGSDGGVYFASDMNAERPSFSARNGGVNTIEFYSGDISAGFDDPASPSRAIIGGAQDNGTSTANLGGLTQLGPAAWIQRGGGDGIYAKIEPVLGQRWYLSGQNGNLFVSTNGPAGTFSAAAPGSPRWSGDRLSFLMAYDLYKWGDAITCGPTLGCQNLIAGTFRVWETIQGAVPNTSWYVNSPDLTKNTLQIPGDNRSFINQLAYAFSDPSIAVVGTNDGNVQMGFGLGQGRADSAIWVNVTDGNRVLPNRPIMDVITAPDLARVAYAAVGGFDQNTPTTPGRVFRLGCSPGCRKFAWRDKSGNLPNVPVNAIMVNPRNPRQVFAGTDWGLWFTDDINVSTPQWRRFTAGLPSVMIWDMTVDRGYTTLAVFTRSRGAFVWPLPDAPAGALTATPDIW
jgi:hypothetical protein